MSGEVLDSWGQFVLKPHRRRRRQRTPGAAKQLLRPQPESSAAYPGFFVLPRSTPDTPHQLHRPRARWWWRELKTILIILIIISSFVGTLGFFFTAVSENYIPAELQAPGEP
jgi:hypothetical protein